MRAENHSTQVCMFHVDVGQVFIWPDPIKRRDIKKVKLPKGYAYVEMEAAEDALEVTLCILTFQQCLKFSSLICH